MSDPDPTGSPGCFPATEWTHILQVIQRGDPVAAASALSGFCEQYRPAIYNFFRRHGCSHELAEDHTQEFFQRRILEPWDQHEGFLHTARRGQPGNFRRFLAHVLWRFLQDEWKKARTAKAGGGIPHMPLESMAAAEMAPDEAFREFGREFDRVFALQIIQRAAERSRHSSQHLAHLRGSISQQAAAIKSGLSEDNFKQAHYRFRQRLAADLKAEVARLVGPNEGEVRAELAYLMGLFAEKSP
jgi:DNA-directed RNA polymerase specialized sigma24 family protein